MILEEGRITICRLDVDTEGMADDSILTFHVDGGADADAFVTPTGDHLVAEVLFAEPRQSDLRRAPRTVSSDGDSVLGSWESLV